jgi:ribosome-associated protein
MEKTNFNSDVLLTAIIEGIFEKKGNEVVRLDLKKLDQTICDYFVICHGDSNTQVESIAESVEYQVEKSTGQNASHKEGVKNSNWVLLDYSDVIVHIFQKDYREYYHLEDLWADARILKYQDNPSFAASNS